MKTTSILDLLRIKPAKPQDPVEAATAAYEAVSHEFESVEAKLAAAEREFGERLLQAGTSPADVAEVQAAFDDLRADRERLRHIRAAIAARLQAAQNAAGADDLAKRWDAAEKALRARRLALVRYERAVSDAATAQLAAEAAARAAWEAIPAEAKSLGDMPWFLSLDGERDRIASLVTDGRIGPYSGSRLWDLRKQPTLMARVEADDALWLKHRPETPPEAA